MDKKYELRQAGTANIIGEMTEEEYQIYLSARNVIVVQDIKKALKRLTIARARKLYPISLVDARTGTAYSLG